MKVLLCVGNELLGDDGIACYLARKFKHKDWLAINASTVPENFLGSIIKKNPELVVIVDSAHMNLKPGSIRLLEKEHACSAFISTHSIPLKQMVSVLEKHVKVVLIGIQPKKLMLGSKLSKEAKQAADKLIKILKEGKLEKIEKLAKR